MRADLSMVFIRNEAEVREHFHHAAPLLSRSLRDYAQGHYTLEDLRVQCETRRAVVAVMFDQGAPQIALAWAPVYYPRQTIIHIMAMGGHGLARLCDVFMPAFEQYCREAGATAIEANCRPAMVRLLSRIGFKSVCHVVRREF